MAILLKGQSQTIVRLIILFFVVIGSSCMIVNAQGDQGLNNRDLSTLKSEDISDQQLKNYVERGKSQGISEAEAMQMARSRGLPASVANQLLQRMRNLDLERPDQRETERRRADADLDDWYSELTAFDIDTVKEDDGPKMFGSELFKWETLTFEPSMNIPTPVNYEIGAGDELVIDVWGAATDIHNIEVSPEGTVNIDNLGPVYVHGLTIKEAEERLIDKLKQLYRGLRPGEPGQDTFARLSLGRVRTIQVSIVGEVERPGNYSLSSLSTVFNALYRSGGPNKIGSFRNIEVIRGNEKVGNLDIYDFLVKGEQGGNIRLNDQDIIKVGTFENRVLVSGQIKRPGYYEMQSSESLADLLHFAGSFTDSAYTRQLRVYRNTETERMIVGVGRDEFDAFLMKNGDEVVVDSLLNRFANRVSISGAVWRPGDYQLKEDMMLSDLIIKSEGVKPDAFRTRAIINRLTDDFDFEVLAFNVNNVLNHPEQYDVLLKAEDEVIIKSIHEMREELTVTIRGEVINGDDFQYRAGMTLEDLILKADGFRKSASEARIEVNRRIIGEAAPTQRGRQMAETFIFGVDRNLTLNGDARQFVLEPFDQVFVRARPDYQEQQFIGIEGEVLYPGDYALSHRNERISDLIERAGGLTLEAYLDGATLVRKITELERVEVEIEGARDEVVELEQTAERHIGIDLSAILADPGSFDDIFLRPGDVIRVPPELQTVSVRGGVLRESEIRHRDGRGLKYYINRSGGFSENARRRHVYVVYANGDVATSKNYLFFRSSPEITAGTEIIIPQKEERPRLTTGERISIMSSVVSMTAVVITAMSRVW